MGLVTDIYWICPGCGSKETAQVYGDYEDPMDFPVDAVPSDRELKWNPPCEKCGKHKLIEPPPVLVKYRIVPTDDIEGEFISTESNLLTHENNSDT